MPPGKVSLVDESLEVGLVGSQGRDTMTALDGHAKVAGITSEDVTPEDVTSDETSQPGRVKGRTKALSIRGRTSDRRR